MPNIPSHEQLDQFFVRTVAQARRKRGYYGMIHRAALQLRAFPFLVYGQISRSANFSTRWCNIRYLRWPWIHQRTKRQLNRTLADLSSTYLVRRDRMTYGLEGRHRRLSAARLKPVRFHVLAELRDCESALLVRFLLFLAWSRVPWSWLRVGSLQKGLRIDRTTAAQLLSWLRGPGSCYTRAQVRKSVFYSQVARLRHYRPDRSDPRGRYAQTRAPVLEMSHPQSFAVALAFKASHRLLTGSGPGGPPGAEGAQLAGALVSCLADRFSLASQPCATGQGVGGTPPAPPAPGKGSGGKRRARPRITADRLIDMMPERMQADMRRRLAFDRARGDP